MNGALDSTAGGSNPNSNSGTPIVAQKQAHDYKLLVDPFLVKAPQKIYRYNGVVPNDPNPLLNSVIVKDPRNVKAIRQRTRLDPLELILPR